MQDSVVSREAEVHVTMSGTMRRQLSAAGRRMRKGRPVEQLSLLLSLLCLFLPPEFYATTKNPTEDEKEQLRQRIGRLPGCEWYSESSRPDINYQSSVRRKEAKKLNAAVQEMYSESI